MVTEVSSARPRRRSLIDLRIVRRPRRDRIIVALYSVVILLFAIHTFNAQAPMSFMTARETDISASIAVLDRGGPPLLGSTVPWHKGVPVGELWPVGVTDDQGIYVYLPELSQLTGEHDPAVLMKWFFIGCFALLILVYPLMFYELFGSIVAAALSPLLVMWRFDFTQTKDLYWILSWCMLLCIPGLALAYLWWSKRRRASVALLVALMLAASFSTSIRIHSGLPILIGGLGIVLTAGTRWWRDRSGWSRFWRQPRWWARPAIAAMLVIAYLSIGTFAFDGIRAYRNHVINDASFGSSWPTQHPFWHNAYIGLGYLPNKYGIQWYDTVAADAVERAHPGTGFLTTRYEATLRHLYFQIAKNDPGFVANTFWTKARVLVADAVERFWFALVLLPLACVVGRFRRLMRVSLAFAIPAALLGALAPILTIPRIEYELAWLGTWGALWVMSIAWAWTTLRDAAVSEVPEDIAPLLVTPADKPALEALRERLRRMPRRAPWAAPAAGLVLALVLTATARPAQPPSSEELYATGQGAFTDSSWLDRPAVASWDFKNSLPQGWQTTPGTVTEPDRSPLPGLYVRSPMSGSTDLLTGPSVTLPPGRYSLVGSGRGLVGGFTMNAVGGNGQTLAAAQYSWEEPNFLTSALWTPFTVDRKTPVHVTIGSWTSFVDATSSIIGKVAIVRDDTAALAKQAAADTSFYRAHAAAPGRAGTGALVADWSFAGGLPAVWGPETVGQLTAAPDGTVVMTTMHPGAGQIWSPPETLRPDSYEIDVDGSVGAGGIAVQAVPVEGGAPLASEGFWSGQRFDGRTMRTALRISKAGQYRVQLANWGKTDHVSQWTVRHVWLRRSG